MCLANISADATLRLTELYATMIREEGLLIASGIVSDRFEECRERLEHNSFKIIHHFEEAFWSCIVAQKI